MLSPDLTRFTSMWNPQRKGSLSLANCQFSSAYYHRWMPGVFSSPILLVSALFLFAAARHWKPVAGSSPLVGTS